MSDNFGAFSIPDRFRKSVLHDLKVAGVKTIKMEGIAATGLLTGHDPKENPPGRYVRRGG